METMFILKKCHRHVALILGVLFVFLAAGCSSDSSGTSSQVTLPLLIISDVHFTPFYDTTIFHELVNSPVEEWANIFESSTVTDLSSWGQETNYPLLKRALAAASRSVGEGQVVIFPGDILAHQFPEKFFKLYGEEDYDALRSFVYKTVVFFATQVRERMGSIPVMFTLGNNDSYAGDYLLVPGGAFLADTAEAFYSTFLLGWADRKNYFSTYPAGGYFVAEPPGAKVLFVSVNSILFSKHRTDGCTDAPDNAATIQLDWLEQVLEKAHTDKKKVFMASHIPTGMSVYSTVQKYMDASGKISDAQVFWTESCQTRFLEICRKYESVIEIVFSGHTHMDEYRLIPDRDGEPYKAIIVTPAVSPQFGNNPAFKVLTLRGEDWKPLNYTTVSCDLNLSSPDFSTYYVFSEAYSMEAPLEESLVDLFPKMKNSDSDRKNYARFYYSGHDDANIIDDTTWPAYWCGIGRMNRGEYIECVNSYR
jgi:sphingomyelin phosphodiesterase acid-like 3